MKILKNKLFQIFIISFTLTLILYSSTKTIKNPFILKTLMLEKKKLKLIEEILKVI